MTQGNDQTTDKHVLEAGSLELEQAVGLMESPEVDPLETDAMTAERHPNRRIKDLELALDQCQGYINELKAMLSDQEFLESQLASTEEYSHIQQKAIAALRDQLFQRQADESELTVLRDQRAALSAQVEQQLQTLSDLRTHLSELETAFNTVSNRNRQLEAELQLAQDTDVESTQQRIIAQQTNERLRAEIRSLETHVQTLEERLHSAGMHQKRYRAVIKALQNAQKSDSQKNLAIRDLSASLLTAQDRILALESEVSSQSLMQAQLQQASFELEENAKDRLQRLDAQEQQIAEMQEQILHQAQEAREYETAVQHWKDKAEKYESFLGQLLTALDDLPDQPKRLDENFCARLIEIRDRLI